MPDGRARRSPDEPAEDAAWSASVLDANYTGTSFDASAGPAAGHGLFSMFQGPVLG